ncbi:MAG: nucleotide pyrophosphohydrolase [Variovorax sp.]|nr:MAG: nucleotide pyrophosphohydrolase [Variovorax sp.]
MDLSALQTTLRQFAAERDWQPFHTPKNLAMALMVEAAELAEIFQWMTPEQSQGAHNDSVVKERIGDEVADVLLYLLQLADHTGLDLKRAVGRKLAMNAKKHPPLRPGLPAGSAAAAAARTHVPVDWDHLTQAVARVEANLQKTTSRPAKETALVAAIASLLGPAANAENIPAVLSGLLAGGKVAIDDKGRVAYAFEPCG